MQTAALAISNQSEHTNRDLRGSSKPPATSTASAESSSLMAVLGQRDNLFDDISKYTASTHPKTTYRQKVICRKRTAFDPDTKRFIRDPHAIISARRLLVRLKLERLACCLAKLAPDKLCTESTCTTPFSMVAQKPRALASVISFIDVHSFANLYVASTECAYFCSQLACVTSMFRNWMQLGGAEHDCAFESPSPLGLCVAQPSPIHGTGLFAV